MIQAILLNKLLTRKTYDWKWKNASKLKETIEIIDWKNVYPRYL